MTKLAHTITIYAEIPADDYGAAIRTVTESASELLAVFGAKFVIEHQQSIPADKADLLT